MGRRTKLVALGIWAAMVVTFWGCSHIMPAGAPTVTSCPGYVCEGFISPDLPGAEVMVCAKDPTLVASFLGFLGLSNQPTARTMKPGPGWVSVGRVGLDGVPVDAGTDGGP